MAERASFLGRLFRKETMPQERGRKLTLWMAGVGALVGGVLTGVAAHRMGLPPVRSLGLGALAAGTASITGALHARTFISSNNMLADLQRHLEGGAGRPLDPVGAVPERRASVQSHLD